MPSTKPSTKRRYATMACVSCQYGGHVVLFRSAQTCNVWSAFETRFHQDFVTFPKTLVDFFGDRAKAFLELELDCPCVTTVQAVVILSCHEIGNGIDARGWLYSGMAIRLAFDLALNLDMSAYASKGDITPEDADLRRTVFWAAYLVDHQLGFHLGRPFRTSMEDVTVGKPHDQGNTLRPSRWIPYGLQDTTTGASGFLDCTEAVSRQLISLCELMAPCGYILYGTSSISKAVLQERNAKIVAELRRWKAKLPPFLQIDLDDCTSPYLPHVLLLHMQYRQNIVYAHRPWMSKSGLQPQPPRGPGYLHAHEMCIQSAISISKILILYEARYTLRRMNVKAVSITSSAILILLFASVSKHPTHSHSDIAMNSSTCFRALQSSVSLYSTLFS
ncbi:transcriptional regulator family: Fungal Specific TF [Paecilomyces variotii]|nr:transcriptional regulator family: Fungal Specific TF [Paecilomyces variotii]KAJ9410045.1 transcriptional regulator family: Fungal Specific TF [Paecilomyces variotii]